MSRYYIRMVHSGLLLDTDHDGLDFVADIHMSTPYLSYGEAQCEALRLRKAGFMVSAIPEAEALESLARLEAV